MEHEREQQAPERRAISGRDLRYVLTIVLRDGQRTMTIDDLVEALRGLGLAPRGRASKTIADALRWEIARGRVRRLTRGRYGTGTIPTSTRWWLRQRAQAVVDGSSVAADDAEQQLRQLQRPRPCDPPLLERVHAARATTPPGAPRRARRARGRAPRR